MKNWKRLASLLLVLAVMAVACTAPGQAVPQGISEGSLARDFTLGSLDGRRVSLDDYRGSVVLINFWATWCPPCKAEIPDIEAAYRAHKDEGFVVLGINVQESRQTVEPFVDNFNMTYPVLLDERGQVVNDYRALGLPMSLVVDREGVIQVRHVGYLSAGQLGEYLAQVLAHSQESASP